MHIVLAAYDDLLATEFAIVSEGLPSVSVHHGSIFDVECDAVVSPANSFGFMDGGIDAQYVEYFGSIVQDRVRLNILNEHDGELIVAKSARQSRPISAQGTSCHDPGQKPVRTINCCTPTSRSGFKDDPNRARRQVTLTRALSRCRYGQK